MFRSSRVANVVREPALNDASFTNEMETSAALGFGFLGLLHLEVVRMAASTQAKGAGRRICRGGWRCGASLRGGQRHFSIR